MYIPKPPPDVAARAALIAPHLPDPIPTAQAVREYRDAVIAGLPTVIPWAYVIRARAITEAAAHARKVAALQSKSDHAPERMGGYGPPGPMDMAPILGMSPERVTAALERERDRLLFAARDKRRATIRTAFVKQHAALRLARTTSEQARIRAEFKRLADQARQSCRARCDAIRAEYRRARFA